MPELLKQLGIFSDMVAEASRQQPLFPIARPGAATQQKVKEVLGWCDRVEAALDVRVEQAWEKDGLAGEELSWSVGYGPRTHAWLLKPAGAARPLPGVLALHDHGGFKYYGKEKIAEGPAAPEAFVEAYQQHYYGGRAWANALAKEGFAVLVVDAFLWGSRKFPVEVIKEALQIDQVSAELRGLDWNDTRTPAEVAEYNTLAGMHEHIVSKYCNVLARASPGWCATKTASR